MVTKVNGKMLKVAQTNALAGNAVFPDFASLASGVTLEGQLTLETLQELNAGNIPVRTNGFYTGSTNGNASYEVLTTAEKDASGYAGTEGYGCIELSPNGVPSGYWACLFVEGFLNVDMVGAKNTDTVDSYANIQTAYDLANLKKLKVVYSSGVYKTTQEINGYQVSSEGLNPSRGTELYYTGSGYALRHQGTGSESDSPLTRFNIKNIWFSGRANTISMGGLYIDRCYIVTVENCFSTGWNNALSVSVVVTNTFNFKWEGGQIANGFPLPAGNQALVLGSQSPDAWNTSQTQIKNTLIQYSAGNAGCEIIHNDNVMDSVTFDNVSFGKNKGWSLRSTNASVSNITVRNCHFESSGYNNTATPEAGTGHIDIANARGVDINNNSFQDAYRHIKLANVDGFTVENNKVFETGAYTFATSEAFVLTATATRNCVGRIGPNAVRTDQIDTLLTKFESNGFVVDVEMSGRQRVNESTWNAAIFPNPVNHQGQIINRFENGLFDQMYSPDGSTWGRMMFSTLYKGEKTTIPTSTESAGSFYLKPNSTEQGTVGDKYVVDGWRSLGGGTWVEMRSLTGN